MEPFIGSASLTLITLAAVTVKIIPASVIAIISIVEIFWAAINFHRFESIIGSLNKRYYSREQHEYTSKSPKIKFHPILKTKKANLSN
jgi:hypothetical protein